jgi:formate hydrogenlyase subunit 3/multisubunit Na+/H+ antiporter MnhD subunit
MFLTAGSIAQKYGSSRGEDVSGVIYVYPVTGVFLLIALLAGTGMFPFATFHSELMVLNAMIISKHYLLAAISVLCLAVIFIGISRLIFGMVYGNPVEPVLEKKENLTMNIAIAVAAIALISFGLWMPHFLSRGIGQAVVLLNS